MERIRNYPLEAIIILAIFYSIFFSSSWSGTGLINKMNSLFIVLLIFIIILLVRFAWPESYQKIKQRAFLFISRIYSSTKFLNFGIYPVLGTMLIFMLVFLEFFTTFIFFGEPVVLGFPYPIYSLGTGQILFFGFFLDLTLYSLLIYLIARIVFETKKNDSQT